MFVANALIFLLNLPTYLSHYPFLMLNVKQKSCEYQLLKSFGLTRPENRTQVYQLEPQDHTPFFSIIPSKPIGATAT